MKYSEGLSQEEKMRMWHAGTRGFNVDAASNEKLQTNLEVCKKLKFKTEAALISKELELRKLKGTLNESKLNECDCSTGAQTSGDLQSFAPENALHKWNNGGFDKAYEKVFDDILKESIDLDKDEYKTAAEVCEEVCDDPTDIPLIKDFFKYKSKDFEANDIIDNEQDYESLVEDFIAYIAQDTINYELGKEE